MSLGRRKRKRRRKRRKGRQVRPALLALNAAV
jgi:hypothetical protein